MTAAEASGSDLTSDRLSLGSAYSLMLYAIRPFLFRVLLTVLLAFLIAGAGVMIAAATGQTVQAFTPQAELDTDDSNLASQEGNGSSQVLGVENRRSPDAMLNRSLSLSLLFTETEPIPVTWILLLLAAGTIGIAALAILNGVLETSTLTRIVVRIKDKIFRSLITERCSSSALPVGRQMGIIQNQTQNVAQLFDLLVQQPVIQLTTLLVGTLQMFTLGWKLTLAFLGVLLLFGVVLPYAFKMDRRIGLSGHNIREAMHNEANTLQELFAGAPQVRAIEGETYASKRAATRFEAARNAEVHMTKVSLIRGLSEPLSRATFPILFLLAFIGILGDVRLGAVGQMLTVYPMMVTGLTGLVSQYTVWQQMRYDLGEVNRYLQVRPDHSSSLPVEWPASLTVENLDTWLPDGTVLHRDLSATIPAGKMIALVGRGGSGKSLLLDILSGQQHPLVVRGTVLLDQNRMDAGELRACRGHFRRINQFPAVMEMPLRDFVAFGMKVLDSEIEAVLEKVGFYEVRPRRIELDEVIGVDFKPSGFERQALRLAQVLLRPVRPYVFFDEPESGCFPSQAACIQRVIQNEIAGGSTVLMVTQLPHLLPNDCELLFFEGGRILARGSHQQLVATSTAYASLVHELEEEADVVDDAVPTSYEEESVSESQ